MCCSLHHAICMQNPHSISPQVNRTLGLAVGNNLSYFEKSGDTIYAANFRPVRLDSMVSMIL